MKTLAEIKMRLEALPERRKGIAQGGLFAQFLATAVPAKQHLFEASVSVDFAARVLQSTEYIVAKKSVKSSARIANNLAEKIRNDANTISASGTEASFIKLTEQAKEALKRVKSGWELELKAQIEKWELIADVIARLGSGSQSLKSKAARLTSAVDALRAAKASLPKTQKDVAAVKENLDQLSDSVAKLGLDTPFGKFLKAAASGEGAPLEDAQEKSVAQQIELLKLSSVFRVRLSS